MGDKKYLAGNTPMLVLKLLEEKEKYGWEIIDELAEKSNDAFRLKTGVLYPILHGLENDGYVTSYNRTIENGRIRKYYKITGRGRDYLAKKQVEWASYAKAVDNVMRGNAKYATV